jgi:hypothetical protein
MLSDFTRDERRDRSMRSDNGSKTCTTSGATYRFRPTYNESGISTMQRCSITNGN